MLYVSSPWRDEQDERPVCYCQNCGSEIYAGEEIHTGNLCGRCFERLIGGIRNDTLRD